jgi:hypothetical protein
MKTLEAINAFQIILRLIDDPSPKSIKFSYALLKNRRALEPVVERYNRTLGEHSDPFLDDLLMAWRELAPAYAETSNDLSLADKHGSIAIKPDRVLDYNLACQDILMEHPEYQAAFERRNNLIAELQDQEVDVAIYPIGLSLFPPETEFATLEALYSFIDGDH